MEKFAFLDELNSILISGQLEDFEYEEIEDDNFIVVRYLMEDYHSLRNKRYW